MAERSTTMPVRGQGNEPLPWPEKRELTPSPEPESDNTEKIKEGYEQAVATAGHSFRVVQRKLSDTTDSILRTFRRFANERPLHLVAIVAGAAFVGGVLLRIWRASRDE